MNTFDDTINSVFKEFSTTHYEFFRLIGNILKYLINISDTILFFFPWFIYLILLPIFVYIINKEWKNSVKVVLLLLVIYLTGYWDITIKSISILLIGIIFSVLIGFFIGILISEFRVLVQFVSPVLDMMQTIPSFVYLIPSIMLFGLGTPSAILSIVIYSMPLMIRLTYSGILNIDKDILEAMNAYGADRIQCLFITKLPLAIRSIVLGITQTILAGLSMMVTASMVGAGGVGQEILSAINQINLGRGLRSGACIVALAIIFSIIMNEILKKIDYER